MTNIVVISAGISVPSSTRILADNLASATAARSLGGSAATDVGRSTSSSCATSPT